MSLLKSLWRKLFGYPADAYYNLDFKPDQEEREPYDPSQDPERIMKGLEESYFD